MGPPSSSSRAIVCDRFPAVPMMLRLSLSAVAFTAEACRLRHFLVMAAEAASYDKHQ
jgi:hypothetical protein